MAAIIAFHTGKTMLQIAAIEIWNHTNISGAFLSWNVVLNHCAICFISGSSMTRASIGQLFTQAQQLIHRFLSVITFVSTVMAAVGHTAAHSPQRLQISSSIMGDISGHAP